MRKRTSKTSPWRRGIFTDPPKMARCEQCAKRIDFTTEIPDTVNAVCSYRCYERREARLTLDGFVQEALSTQTRWKYLSRYGCDEVTLFQKEDAKILLVLYASVR